jgi:adenylate cyclase class 2
MPKEYETRVLDIDKDAIIAKLEQLGAKKIKDVLQRRKTFDYPDRRLDKGRAWVRLRDTGEGKFQLAYKCHMMKGEGAVADCEEIEFDVEDFERPEQLLLAIGLERKGYQETRRTRYQLDDLQFDLDEWPMLNPFIEVEGPSEERVLAGLALLGFRPEDTFPGHAGDIYEKEGIDWTSMKEIRFE